MILGTGVHNNKPCKDRHEIDVRHGFGRILVSVVMLLCLFANSWGACTSVSYWRSQSGQGMQNCFQFTMSQPLPSCGWANDGTCFTGSQSNLCACTYYSLDAVCKSILPDPNGTSKRYLGVDQIRANDCRCYTQGCAASCHYTILCDTQAEADSVANSQQQGGIPENCRADYEQCVGLGGVWEKVGSDSQGCASTCNLCNSAGQTRVKNQYNKVCCSQNKAPPSPESRCIPPRIGSGYGMESSSFVNDDGEIQCGSLTTSDGQIIEENAELYKRFCIDGEQYEEESDTNSVSSSSGAGGGDGSSSSGAGGTSSFETELDALGGIYGVLDTIRDTLIYKLAPDVEKIADCLYSFRLCAQLDSIKIDWSNMPKDSSWLYIDTAILKYIKPLMDSSLALDSNQLKALRHLDTNTLKQLHLDSVSLKNDSTTRRAIVGGLEDIDSSTVRNTRAIHGVDSSIVHMDSSVNRGFRDGVDSLIDSIGKYLGKVDSSIGAVGGPGTPLGDSLGHISGLLGGIGDSLASWGSADGSGIDTGSGSGYGIYDGIMGGGGHSGDTLMGIYTDNVNADSLCEGEGCIFDTTLDSVGIDTSEFAPLNPDSLKIVLDSSIQSDYDSLEVRLQTAFDTLVDELQLVNFDSLIITPLGMKVPNTNTCPADCFRFSGGAPSYMGSLNIDFGLCRSWPALGGLNVFQLIRLIVRVIVAITCVYIGAWFIAGKK